EVDEGAIGEGTQVPDCASDPVVTGVSSEQCFPSHREPPWHLGSSHRSPNNKAGKRRSAAIPLLTLRDKIDSPGHVGQCGHTVSGFATSLAIRRNELLEHPLAIVDLVLLARLHGK